MDEQKLLNIPEDICLPDIDGTCMPFVFVADEAFSISKHVLRPYARKNLTNLKRIFNYRLTRARRMVECAFGILANKWRIFHRPLDVNPEFCDSIVKAACILHNLVRLHDGKQVDQEDIESTTYFNNIAPSNKRGKQTALNNRTYFARYFTSPAGNVSWQYEYI
ncbi:hypothetical protein NQ314_017561 [Rhamnusium bicolor]|uniref:DDE Tnp4 domain-containing protein n=1 Tax=Rhamnusium bicolor TaxID=1586634 RepID=A0AAV8WSE7_9CUCU|nr:hypothetical protein NQ314_017561 [Rhamnusium bicolor]